MIEVYIIHLEYNEGRKKVFSTYNNAPGIRFIYEKAIDGSNLNIPELVTNGLVVAGTKYYTQGQLGCALSHRNLWLKTLVLQVPLIVCEDDAVLRNDFAAQWEQCLNQLPEDWDILLLGFNFDSIIKFQIIPGVEQLSGRFENRPLDDTRLRCFQATTIPPIVLPLANAFGTPGYAISPKGAQTLLTRCFPLNNGLVTVPLIQRTFAARSIDCLLNIHYQKIKAFVTFPPLVVTPNRKEPAAQLANRQAGTEIMC